MPDSSVAINYIRTALASAAAAGLDTRALLVDAAIQPVLLDEARARVAQDQYVRLTLAAMRACNDEFLLQGGIRRTPVGTFAMMCRGIVHEPTLRRALVHAIRFYNLLLPDIRLALHVLPGRARFSVTLQDPSRDPPHVVTEVILVLAQRLAGWLIGQHIALTEARFRHARPAHAEEYRRLFHCPLAFGADMDAVYFPAALLDWPVVQTPRSLRLFLRDAPGNLLVIPDNDDSTSARVRAALGRDFTREPADLEHVAAGLGTTPQTLRRRLREEGTSFQEIKDNLRRDEALRLLAKPQLSIMEIAQLTGFSEPSTFHRAFKKWTGLTPGAYRQGQEPES